MFEAHRESVASVINSNSRYFSLSLKSFLMFHELFAVFTFFLIQRFIFMSSPVKPTLLTSHCVTWDISC